MLERPSGFALTELLVAYVVLALAALPASLALTVSLQASWRGTSKARVALAMDEVGTELSRLSGPGVPCATIRSDSITTGGIGSVWIIAGASPRLTVSLRTTLSKGTLQVADSATLYLPCT